ncbi:MAG: threonine--tRNA ligase, partial [Elusimicrobia bacterium]|nr:threonine--tRNA ligase [Elusimicrobiota bacterium]
MNNEFLEKMRHSCSHVMAQAVKELFPETKLGIGPSIENGFYYDFDSKHQFVPEDLGKIEEAMRRIIKQNQPFACSQNSKASAEKYFASLGETYKIELIKDLTDEKVSYYTNGNFTDLCKGPHLESTGQIKHFKLTSIAGAYWRGDEKRPMLTRIYGIAFETKEQLEEHIKLQEEAQKRDHRKLGKELGIFFFDENVGPGLPLWLPNGGIIIEEIEKLAKETEFAQGYCRVKTPHICKESMYEKSGHLAFYKESMFPPMELDGVRYYLKPMNCPHHHKIFGAQPRSYRDLPLRLAEYGTCYRYEQSGELFGLMRVRSMQMNDAHIYCTWEQVEEEFLAVSRMYLNYFKIFGIEKFMMRFSAHAPEGLGKKYVNEPALWKRTEEITEHALKKSGIEYVRVPDEAAFYGPKIDVQIWSAIGREFSLATNQVDFAGPGRFGLTYKSQEGKDECPLCIHRAPLGTHERFIGFLIEHFAGWFPLWLAPVQVKILTLTSNEESYAKTLAEKMKKAGIRAGLDVRPEKIGAKIRQAHGEKIGYMIVVG